MNAIVRLAKDLSTDVLLWKHLHSSMMPLSVYAPNYTRSPQRW